VLPNSARRSTILVLALPIIGGMVSQNVLNLVDTYMVGSLGDAALAAVGMGGFANWLTMAFITGLATGVQAIAARRKGEDKLDEMALPLNGGLLLALTLGIPMSLGVIYFAPRLFPILIDDPAVYELGIPYLRVRLIGLTAIAMNFAFRGYWNGVNLSRLYMRTLVIMHITNITLNWLLIFGHFGFPEMGTTGAGLASAISAYVGLGVYFFLGFKHARPAGFLRGIPAHATMKTMLRLAIPSGIQQLFFAGGMTTFMWIIGHSGTRELAVSNVIINLILVAILPGMGFGLAAASLVGQALGRKNPKDAMRWGWEVALFGSIIVSALAVPVAVFPEFFLGIFVHDPATIAVGALALRIAAAGMFFDVFGMVIMNAHFGAGAASRVTVISVVMQWVIFLPAAYFIGVVWGLGLTAVWIGQFVYRTLQTVLFIASWKQGTWANSKV
jgi:putative MATE family efflux protein